MSNPFFATAPDQLPDRDTVLSMSGLEFMRAIAEGRIPAAPIARQMEFTLHDVQDGQVTFRGAPGFDQMNPTGTIHGGWYATSISNGTITGVDNGKLYATASTTCIIMTP